MTTPIVVKRLVGSPEGSIDALVAESGGAGLPFVRRLVEEWASGANRFDRPGEALFRAAVDGETVGVCGLNIDPYTDESRVGRVRHLYVLSRFRRRGIGRRLIVATIAAAQDNFDILRLRTNNPAAAQFYEVLGFHPGEAAEADATHILDLRSIER